jgi:hypothetical protein
MAYNSLIVEERVESLVYDIGSFLAAAGGNLVSISNNIFTVFTRTDPKSAKRQ